MIYCRGVKIKDTSHFYYAVQDRFGGMPAVVSEYVQNRNTLNAQKEYGIRTSLENFAEYEKIKVYPLYAIGNILKK